MVHMDYMKKARKANSRLDRSRFNSRLVDWVFGRPHFSRFFSKKKRLKFPKKTPFF